MFIYLYQSRRIPKKFTDVGSRSSGRWKVVFIKHTMMVLQEKGVLVGVLDTGCDADHVQFRQKRIDFCHVPLHYESEKLREIRGFDISGHGTHVCGIIAGQHIGIAPEADLMVASVIESETASRQVYHAF